MQRLALRTWGTVLALIAGASCSGGDGSAPGPAVSEIQDGAYLPDDGLVVVEMESGAAGGGWTAETALGGFTGASYLRWTGANLFSSPGADPFGFDFWIEDPGRYHFRIHNRHDDPDSTMANDLWVRMDGGAWVKAFSWQRGQWTWATQHEFSASDKPQAEYTLTRGNHRVEFSGRSFDFIADRFHLYNDGVVDPLNTSHPESTTFNTGGIVAPGAREGDDGDDSGADALLAARLEIAPFFEEELVGAGPGPPSTLEEGLGRFDHAWDPSSPALGQAEANGQGVDVVLARAGSVAHGGWNLAASPGTSPGTLDAAAERAIRAASAATAHLGDVRWIFEAGPGLDAGTLMALAQSVAAIDEQARPRILRARPGDILRAWPDILHGPIDGLVLLASQEPGDLVTSCLTLIEGSGRGFTVEIRGGAEGTKPER